MVELTWHWYTEGGIYVNISEFDTLALEYRIMTSGHQIVLWEVVERSFPFRNLKVGEEYLLDVAIPMPEQSGE